MNELTRHRGPDETGFFVDDQISLGHNRLSIIDLSAKGRQPMFDSKKEITLVFNGEIYNFQELKKELEKKYVFNSKTDTEVIIYAYLEYGEECLKKFNGIFSFALWDGREQKLFLARDRVGVKPLYYYFLGDKFIFSSEIKALLAHDIPREVDVDALNIYLRALYVPAPLTMFKNIKKLEPGHYLILEKKQLRKIKYWDPQDFKNYTDKEEAIGEIKKLMKDAIRLQLISDRPVGVFLSGGIDSTAITGLVSEFTGSKVKTFSTNYDIKGDKFNLDADLAKRTSAYYQTDHTEIEVSGCDALENIFETVYHLDEPVANATTIATYLLSKRAKQEVAVVLGGDGGDELFGGYERYLWSQRISRYQKMPEIFRNLIGKIIKNKKFEKFGLPPSAKRYLSFMSQKETVINNILSTKINKNIIGDFYQTNYFSHSADDFEKMFMWTDVRSWLPDESLIRSDKMSMAHGLEQRVPILDHRLVELSLKIPTNWKINGHNKKAIFKTAMKEYLPDYVLNQPKRGWTAPASVWLRNELKDLAYQVLSPNYCPNTRLFFNFKAIKQMLDDHLSGRVYNMNLLWALLFFQIWYKKFIEIKIYE